MPPAFARYERVTDGVYLKGCKALQDMSNSELLLSAGLIHVREGDRFRQSREVGKTKPGGNDADRFKAPHNGGFPDIG